MLIATHLVGFGAGTQDEVFTPASVTLKGWWDPSDISTLWKNTAGTDPVTADGDLVARMDDKSGNGRNWTQATSTNRPTYKVGSGLHWLDFDGTDDYMTGATLSNLISVSAYEVILAGRFDTIASNAGTSYSNDVFLADDGGYIAVAYGRTSGVIGAGQYGSSDTVLTFAYSSGNNFVLSQRLASGLFYASYNGGSESSGSAANVGSGAGTALIGKSYNGDFVDGRFYGAVTKNAALTTTERDNLITWLGAKAGLSV